MQTDSILNTREGKRLTISRFWYVLALTLFFLSMIVQQPLLFLAALFSCVMGMVPGLCYRHALRHLVVRQQVNPTHLFFREEAALILSIENQKLFPVPWLQLEDHVTPPLPTLAKEGAQRENIGQINRTWVLWPFQRVTRRFRLRSRARGCYTFGPVKLRSSDPFGWLEREVTLPLYETLLVYPLLASPAAIGLPAFHPFGDGVTARHLLEDPLSVMGVRDYQLGDDPRRIHWKATAHAGALRSKIYEYNIQQRVLLLLDTGEGDQAWGKMDLEMLEFSIAVAASLAVWALGEGYMVGLLTNCAMRMAAEHTRAKQPGTWHETGTLEELRTTQISAPGVSIPFASDYGQYERLLATFSRLVLYDTAPLETIIAREDDLFSARTTVLLVTMGTTLSQATVERLLDMRTRGIALYAALTGDPAGESALERYNVPVHYLGGKEKWHELLRAAGDPASETLDSNSLSPQLD